MGSSNELWRCGCGELVKHRQSCERCATAARARLHAGYVAHSEDEERMRHSYREEMGFDRPNGGGSGVDVERFWRSVDDAVREVESWPAWKRPTQSPDPRTRAGTSLLSHACAAAIEAHRLTGVVPYAVATPQAPERPAVEWVTKVNVNCFELATQAMPTAIGHMCLWLQCGWWTGSGGYVKLREGDARSWLWTVHDGVIEFADADWMVSTERERAALLEPKIGPALPESMRAPHPQAMPDEQASPPSWWERKYDGEFIEEPPPVGAEVPWSVAEADMQRRPEARYQTSEGFAYRCHAEQGVEFQYLGGEWHPSLNGHRHNEKLRWMRLA